MQGRLRGPTCACAVADGQGFVFDKGQGFRARPKGPGARVRPTGPTQESDPRVRPEGSTECATLCVFDQGSTRGSDLRVRPWGWTEGLTHGSDPRV